ncbi:MAG: hypothetical protein SOZ34_03855 [Clostridia bacterium]|nr:hypothetical protein [Clostridia bacterium]
MKKENLKRVMACLVCVSLSVAMLCSCDKKEEHIEGNDYTSLLGQVNDSSELPDWTGSKLSLKAWYSHGTGNNERRIAKENVVANEIERITGVRIDPDTSYDNGGNTFDVKLSMMAAANDYPDIVFATKPDELKKMVEADKLWELSELVKEHCPNIMEKIPMDTLPQIYDKLSPYDDGKMYFVPTQLSGSLWKQLYPEADATGMAFALGSAGRNDYTTLYVREDILNMIYPDVKTTEELKETYMENGTFTKEEIYDIPIYSREEFIDFLYKIKAVIDENNIREDNKKVEVTYAACGQDNWALLACLESTLNGTAPSVDYFTYYDTETDKLEYTFKQEWFKKNLNTYRKLVEDGVMSKESLLDNRTNFTTKLNNGLYAVIYGMDKPDEEALKAAGKDCSYRRIYLDIPLFDKVEPLYELFANDTSIGLCKDNLTEEEVIQVLKWIDFMMSDVAEKLQYWGPATAGLFTEENGQRKYVDEELEQNMVYGVDNGKNIEYGLLNQRVSKSNTWPAYPYYMYVGIHHPSATCEHERNAADYSIFFTPGLIEGYSLEDNNTRVPLPANLWYYTADVTNVEKFWNARDIFEKELTKVLAASDSGFETKYNELVKLSEQYGLTDETLEEMNTLFNEKNKEYLHLFK